MLFNVVIFKFQSIQLFGAEKPNFAFPTIDLQYNMAYFLKPFCQLVFLTMYMNNAREFYRYICSHGMCYQILQFIASITNHSVFFYHNLYIKKFLICRLSYNYSNDLSSFSAQNGEISYSINQNEESYYEYTSQDFAVER